MNGKDNLKAAPRPTCECGHGLHLGRCEEDLGRPRLHCGDNYADDFCSCEQFTDARLAALRAENDELKRVANMGGWYFAYMEEAVPKILRLENTISTLEAEVARLTPRMVRDVPTKAGWYWLKHELTIVKPFPVEVFDRSGVMCLREDGRYYRPINDYAIALWSAEPIPMPVIEKEGE